MSDRRGFTIVELLIVIVVIAILAVITVVAFNGVRDRANDSAAKSAAIQAAKKMESAKVTNGEQYPTSLAAAEIPNLDNKYQYTGTATTYCITSSVGTKSYRVSESATAPVAGGCAGHGQGGVAAITNYIANPSAELALTGYSGPNGATVARTTAMSRSGTNSILVTMATGGGTSNGANVTTSYSVPGNLQANTQYQLSLWVYVPTGTVDVTLSTQGTGVAVVCSGSSRTTAVKNTWTRLSCPFTTAASGSLALYVLNAVASTAGMQFYVDSAMVTEGSSLPNYADGDTSDWIWNGSAHNSTSTGPAL